MTDNGLHPEWRNIARRLQAEAGKSHPSFAVVSIKVVVNQNGAPIGWLPPEISRFEPKKGDMTWLVDMLT